MIAFVAGVAVGAAFSPFWLSLWKKIEEKFSKKVEPMEGN